MEEIIDESISAASTAVVVDNGSEDYYVQLQLHPNVILSTERRLEGNNNNNNNEEEEEEVANEAQYGAYDDALVEYDDAQNNNANVRTMRKT